VGRWFDTSAYANPVALMFGNSPRSGLRGLGGYDGCDCREELSLTERWKVDLRVEAYNLFNHAIFNVPGFTLGLRGFWSGVECEGARTAQLAARLVFKIGRI